MLEKDYNCYTSSQRNAIKTQIYEQTKSQEYFELDYDKVGYPKPGAGKMLEAASYASCLRIVDPRSFETVYLQEFEEKETAFSLYVSKSVGYPGQAYLFLGIGVDATLQRGCKAAWI